MIESHSVHYIVRVGARYATDSRGGRGTFGEAARFGSAALARRCAARIQLTESRHPKPPEVAVVRVTLQEVT